MKRLTLLLSLIAASALAQTQITTTIGPNQSAKSIAIIVPRPDTALPLEAYNAPFFAPLTRDLAYSGVFAIAPIPPNIPAGTDLAKAANAQFVLALTKFVGPGAEFVQQPRILHRDHRLGGEALKQSDLLVRKATDFLAVNRDHAMHGAIF